MKIKYVILFTQTYSRFFFFFFTKCIYYSLTIYFKINELIVTVLLFVLHRISILILLRIFYDTNTKLINFHIFLKIKMYYISQFQT